jgi:hypothetical protein
MSTRSITIQTNDTIVTSGEELGKLSFAASAESDGGSAIAVGARVIAQAEGAFQSASNPTSLVFATTSASAAASGKIKISDNGHILPMANNTYDIGDQNLRFRNAFAASGYFSDRVATSGSVFFANGNTFPVGAIQWDDGEGTVSLGLKGGNVNLEIGQEQLSLCYNGTGSTLNKGKVVYIVGAQGQRPSVALASNTTETTSSKTLGIVAENISNGAEGFVATYGIVRNLDTSGFEAGSGLWLSTNGDMTMTRPTQPGHGVFIGYAMSVNAHSGRIFVRVQNGFEIEELHNVLITNLASGDILRYDSSSQLWKNIPASTVAAGSGITIEDSIINALIFG